MVLFINAMKIISRVFLGGERLLILCRIGDYLNLVHLRYFFRITDLEF